MSATKDVVIDVVGGMVRLTFSPGYSTGRERDTNPGIGFAYESDAEPRRNSTGKYCGGKGVIGRKQAADLRDMLDKFLGPRGLA